MLVFDRQLSRTVYDFSDDETILRQFQIVNLSRHNIKFSLWLFLAPNSQKKINHGHTRFQAIGVIVRGELCDQGHHHNIPFDRFGYLPLRFRLIASTPLTFVGTIETTCIGCQGMVEGRDHRSCEFMTCLCYLIGSKSHNVNCSAFDFERF